MSKSPRKSDSKSKNRRGASRPGNSGDPKSSGRNSEKKKSAGKSKSDGKDERIIIPQWPKGKVTPRTKSPKTETDEQSGYKPKWGEKRPKDSRSFGDKKPGHFEKRKKALPKLSEAKDGIRLNKYMSNAGICSRREADVLIKTGVVSINGKTITELGVRVMPGDIVKYDGETIKKEKHRYILLNKPKNFITTTEDPQGRKTVMTLLKGACKERVAPVGKLDRNSTGLLLFTNDTELAKRLLHPRHETAKIFHVVTDEKVKITHLREIRDGITLEDGTVTIDEIDFIGDGKDHRQIGLKIRSGRSGIVRRTFEHFGYNVVKLDRVMIGGLTKKDLPRGHWRHLSEKEVAFLRIGQG